MVFSFSYVSFFPHLFFLFFGVELIPAQANSGCAVDRRSQRAAWCPRRVFSGSCSLHMNAPVSSQIA